MDRSCCASEAPSLRSVQQPAVCGGAEQCWHYGWPVSRLCKKNTWQLFGQQPRAGNCSNASGYSFVRGGNTAAWRQAQLYGIPPSAGELGRVASGSWGPTTSPTAACDELLVTLQ